MAKKKKNANKKKAPVVIDSDDDENFLEGVDEADVELATENFKSSFNDALMSTMEKSAQVRIAGLRNMCRLLAFSVQQEAVLDSQDSLLNAVARLVVKGTTAEERKLACQAVSLIFVTVGSDNQEAYEDVLTILQRAVKNQPEAEFARVPAAAMETLVLACFIAPIEDSATFECAQFLKEIWSSGEYSAPSRAAALNGWAIMMTALPQSVVCETSFEDVMDVMSSLDDDALSVRQAAGNAIACVFEISHVYACTQEEDAQDLTTMTDDDTFAPLVARLHDLSVDSSRYIGKKDRTAQKSFFKDVIAVLETGECDVDVIHVKGVRITAATWAERQHLRMFRSCLGGGLPIHLSENDLCGDIFGDRAAILDKNMMSAQDKRLVLSSNSRASKDRTRDRQKKRDTKASGRFNPAADDGY